MDTSILDYSVLNGSEMIQEPILPISLTPSVFRPFAYRILSKKYGLNVQSTALEKLASYVGRRFGTKWKRDPKTSAFLDALAKLWKEQGRGIFMDGEGVTQLIKELTANEQRNQKKLKETLEANKNQNLLDDLEKETSQNRFTEKDGDGDSSMNLDSTIYDGSSNFLSSQMAMPMFSNSSQLQLKRHDSTTIEWSSFFQVVDSNHYTCFKYDKKRKTFEYSPTSKKMKLIQLPEISQTLNYYLSRLDLLRDRLYRNHLFSKVNYDDKNTPKAINQKKQPKHITAVKNLLGRNEQRFVLFGLVTLNAYGLWQLQDDSDKIELVLKQCIFPDDSYFVSGNFLIVDGFYSSVGKFHVLSIQHPPAEQRHVSLDALGNLDFNWDFSKNGKIDLTMKALTQKQIKSHPDHKIIMLGGNLYLDDLDIMARLKKTLQEIETELDLHSKETGDGDECGAPGRFNDRTISIIFNGPFISKPVTVTEGSSTQITSTSIYKTGFDNLAFILEQFSNICNSCKLVFIPGNEDPWLSMVTKNSNSIWPQMQIPAVFGSKLRRVVKDLVWSTNPTRLNYLTHDIAIMRDDIGDSFKRNDFSYICDLSQEEIQRAARHSSETQDASNIFNSLSQLQLSQSSNLEIDKLASKENSDLKIFKKTVKTLLDQGIMTPFVHSIRPILPNYWTLMTLLPIPDVLLICDVTSPRLASMYKGCTVANTGSFYENGCGNYIEYYPSTQLAKFKTVY